MTEQIVIEVDGELIHVHSESDVEAVSDVLVKRGRGRPRTEKPPKDKISGEDVGMKSQQRRISQCNKRFFFSRGN